MASGCFMGFCIVWLLGYRYCSVFICCCFWCGVHNFLRGGLFWFVFGVWFVVAVVLVVACAGMRHFLLFSALVDY